MNIDQVDQSPPSQLRRQAAPDRRLHRRVAWTVGVRGLSEDGVEFAARTVDICAGGLRLSTDTNLVVGQSVILYLDEIGRVEGSIVRQLCDDEFAVALRTPTRKREKIADQLTWLINRDRLALEEDRTAQRRAGSGQVIVTFGQGMTVACSVIDISLFGVALRTNGPRPQLGVRVQVGDRTGTCVRFIDGGFAVDFRAASHVPSPS